MNNWIVAVSTRVFKCWDRTAPGVCLPEKAPYPSYPASLPPSVHRSSPPLLISLIKDILCSPPAIALQQQIRQSARVHTHRLLRGDGGSSKNGQAETDRISDGQKQKHRAADLKCTHTSTWICVFCFFFSPYMQ